MWVVERAMLPCSPPGRARRWSASIPLLGCSGSPASVRLPPASTPSSCWGGAESLPFPDASFDLVVSVFGVIFTAEPERAVGEMLRVLRPDGRVLIAAWLPTGAIATLMGCVARAVAAATSESVPERFAWHDRDIVAEIALRHGARVDAHDGEVQFSRRVARGLFRGPGCQPPSLRRVPRAAGECGPLRRCQARGNRCPARTKPGP